jgi:phosphoglycolate phosphatase
MLLVTDLDGTLYSWVDFIVPALEAMIDSICATTGEPRIRVVQALKKVYERYESNEYPFALQESELFHPYAADFESFDRLVIDPAREAFKAKRKRYLKLFRTVRETLAALKAEGVTVIALTDAPRNSAEQRLRQLELEELVDGLYCLPAFAFPESGVSEAIRRKDQRGEYRARVPVVELPRDHEKPDPRGYLRICADRGVRAEDTIFVGDNVKKDVALARAVGALDVWAAYGSYVPLEYRDRLDVVSASRVTRRHVSDADAPAPEATHALAEFRDLLPIVRAFRENRPRRAG